MKWHFAGEIALGGKPLTQALADAYGTLSFADWVAVRQANLAIIFDKARLFPADAWRLLSEHAQHEAIRPVVENSFYNLAYSLWFFSPWLVVPCSALLWARRRSVLAELPPGSAGAVVAGLLFWCLVMFIPGSTAIHQGAYFNVLLLHVIVMLIVAAVSRPLFLLLAALNIAVCIAAYMLDRPLLAIPNGQAYALSALALTSCFLATCTDSVRSNPRPVQSIPAGSR